MPVFLRFLLSEYIKRHYTQTEPGPGGVFLPTISGKGGRGVGALDSVLSLNVRVPDPLRDISDLILVQYGFTFFNQVLCPSLFQ